MCVSWRIRLCKQNMPKIKCAPELERAVFVSNLRISYILRGSEAKSNLLKPNPKECRAGRLEKLSAKERREKLEALFKQTTITSLPDVFKVAVTTETAKSMPYSTKQEIEAWLAVVNPFSVRKVPFNALEPSLSTADLPEADRAKVAVNLIIMQVLVPALYKGETAFLETRLLVIEVLQMVETALAGGLSLILKATAEELRIMLVALKAIMSDDVLEDGNLKLSTESVRELVDAKAVHGCKFVLQGAISQQPFYAARETEFLQSSLALSTLQPELHTCQQLLESIPGEVGDAQGSLKIAADVAEKVAGWRDALHPGGTASIEKLLIGKLSDIFAELCREAEQNEEQMPAREASVAEIERICKNVAGLKVPVRLQERGVDNKAFEELAVSCRDVLKKAKSTSETLAILKCATLLQDHFKNKSAPPLTSRAIKELSEQLSVVEVLTHKNSAGETLETISELLLQAAAVAIVFLGSNKLEQGPCAECLSLTRTWEANFPDKPSTAMVCLDAHMELAVHVNTMRATGLAGIAAKDRKLGRQCLTLQQHIREAIDARAALKGRVPWGGPLEALRTAAEKFLTDLRDVTQKLTEEALARATEKIVDVAAGGQSGESWKASITESSSWAEVVKAAEPLLTDKKLATTLSGGLKDLFEERGLAVIIA